METTVALPAPKPSGIDIAPASIATRGASVNVRAAATGAIAVLVALGVGELAAGAWASVPSPLDAVGGVVVPGVPGGVVAWAIETFGTSNRAVLTAGTILIAMLLGAITGGIARVSPRFPLVVFAAFGVLGAVASLAQPGASPTAVAVALTVAVVSGLLVLRRLLKAADAADTREGPQAEGSSAGRSSVDRRDFLRLAAGAGVAAVLFGAVGRYALGGRVAAVPTTELSLPPPARALPTVGSGTDLSTSVDGVSALFTPNSSFYRIDTAIVVPRVDPETWRLRVHGLVDREIELTYDDLLAEPLEEVDVTIACVSNEVGGELIGNARWLGVPLASVLERAGIRPEAEQIVGRSVDGWTAGFPVEAAFDGRRSLLAVGMNGEALPVQHGFPVRLIVPGLYGYVSATKWLQELELTTWDGFDAYWVPRGWSKEAPVKTASRIDVPANGVSVAPGELVVAGVAWAPTRGIERVELRLDDGPWVSVDLATALSADTWVQWHGAVEVAAGDHEIVVRAIDGDGVVQPIGPAPPAPDGAEGWHRVRVRAG